MRYEYFYSRMRSINYKRSYIIAHFFRLVNIKIMIFSKTIDFLYFGCYNSIALWKTQVVSLPEWRNWQTPGT